VFVVIDDPFVEGLVRIDGLSDDYYTFDEQACRLVGRRSGRVFALGDTVKVEVQSVSVVRRKVDFALHGHEARERDRRLGERRRRAEGAPRDDRRKGDDRRLRKQGRPGADTPPRSGGARGAGGGRRKGRQRR
jgi:ribonuclease R